MSITDVGAISAGSRSQDGNLEGTGEEREHGETDEERGGPLYPRVQKSPHRKAASAGIFTLPTPPLVPGLALDRSARRSDRPPGHQPAPFSASRRTSQVNVWNRTAFPGFTKRLADWGGSCHLFVGYRGDSMMELLTEIFVAGTFVYGLGFVFR
jgi:hypothetical protein